MWEVDRAVRETARFEQLKDGRWKATYKGFVTLSAEGATPTESERRLNDAMDARLASLIRGEEACGKPAVATAACGATNGTGRRSGETAPAGGSSAKMRVQKRR